MNTEREVKRDGRREQHVPEPDENMTYKEETTVTYDANPRLPGPPQESGTMIPHD